MRSQIEERERGLERKRCEIVERDRDEEERDVCDR